MNPAGTTRFTELPLLIWLSPAFPVGGFAYSHGLEAAVEAGLVPDAAALSRWVADLLEQGSIRQDTLLLGAASRAVLAGDSEALAGTNDLALALCPGRERHLETAAMGNAFLQTVRATWPGAVPPAFSARDVAYPVAVGMASAAEHLDLSRTVAGFALAFVANLVSAAVRLGVVGQSDGQRVTAGALPLIESLAAAADHATLDDLGGCAFRSDLAALHHETQYSRLFRS